MASLQIGSNEKLEVLADLIYLARHSPAGAELQLRCLYLAAEVILKGEVCSSFPRRGIIERWHIWVQRTEENRPKSGRKNNREALRIFPLSEHHDLHE